MKKVLNDFNENKNTDGEYEFKVTLDSYTLEKLLNISNVNNFELNEMFDEAINNFIDTFLD